MYFQKESSLSCIERLELHFLELMLRLRRTGAHAKPGVNTKTQEASSPIQNLQMKGKHTDMLLNLVLLQQVNLSTNPAQCHEPPINTARKLLPPMHP